MTAGGAHRHPRRLPFRSVSVGRRARPEPYLFDDDGYVEQVSHADMARAGARGSIATLGGTWAKFIVQSGTTVAMAHIISPKDFGVVAMVTSISGLGELLRDLGLSFAVIQAKTLTRAQASTMFWYTVGLGTLVAIALAAASNPIAEFFHQPQVRQIVPIMALSVIISSLGAQHIALLDRSLGFTRVMMSDFIATIVACAIAIALAAAGAGFWALVALNVAAAVVRSALAWVNVRWIPGRIASFDTVSTMVVFGFHQMVAQLLNYASRNIDNVVVGRRFGPAILGQYSQAYQLLLIPLQQVNAPLQRVAIPLLSRSVQDRTLYRAYFKMSIRLMGLTLIPLFALSAVLARGVVITILGPKWEPSAEIFQILCIAGATQSLGYSCSWLFISTGRGAQQVFISLITRPVVVASFFVGAIWGVKGLALAYSITSAVMLVPTFIYATRTTPVTFGDFVSGTRELLFIVPVMTGSAWFINREVLQSGGPVQLALVCAATVATVEYLLAWRYIPSCRDTAALVLRTMRHPSPVVPVAA